MVYDCQRMVGFDLTKAKAKPDQSLTRLGRLIGGVIRTTLLEYYNNHKRGVVLW